VNKKSARMVEMKKKLIKDEMTHFTSDSNQPINQNTMDFTKPVYERLHNMN